MTHITTAQKGVDSLKKNLNNPKTKSYVLSLIATQFLDAKIYDSALVYYHRSLKTEDDFRNEARTFNSIGKVFSLKGTLDSSKYYYHLSLGAFNQLADTMNIALVESNLSMLYAKLELYDKSLEHAFKALSHLEMQPSSRALSSCYNTIALIFTSTGELPRAIQYHRKALYVRMEIDYQKGVGQSYNNIGEVYLSLEKYDSAVSNFRKALQVKNKLGEEAEVTLNNIGEAYLKLNHFKEASQYFNASLSIRRRHNDRQGEVLVLHNLAQAALQENNLIKAEELLTQGKVLSKETGSLERQRRNLELQIMLFEKKKDFDRSFQLSKQLLLVKDSIINKEKAQTLIAMQAKYEAEKREQQIELLGKERNLQEIKLTSSQTKLQWSYVTGFFLVVIAGLSINQYRLSRRRKEEAELFLQELNHRVKNNFQIFSSILTLQAEQMTDEKSIGIAKSNEGRLNAMALIHQKFIGQDDKKLVNLKEYVTEIVDYLQVTYGFDHNPVKITMDIAALDLNPDKAIPIGLLVNELVSNAFKHAFHDQRNPEVFIGVSMTSHRQVSLNVRDNGAGLNEEKQSTASFGFKMLNMITKQLRGTLEQKGGPDDGVDTWIHFTL